MMENAAPEPPAPAKRRFSLPAGRYQLSKLFFNFYLLTMGSFIAIAIVADFVITTALRDISDDYTRRFMEGTVSMIEEDLFRQRRSDWTKRIKVLGERFNYRLGISERHDIRLPPAQAARLDAGDLAISADGEIVYHRLKNTAQILVIGPLSPGRDPDNRRVFTLEMRIRILTWGLISFFLAIAVWLWVRPVWRDLEALRQTARAFGEGDFAARAPAVNNASFELLAETLNAMAERVQRLIATQKELSSAISHELRTPIARLRFALEMIAETSVREERERLWRMMEADLDELDNLIDSSLTYARFEREQPELQLAATEIEPWLAEQVEDVRILAGSLALELDTGALPAGQRVELDRKSMPFAVRNLLRNAIKYAQSRIVISAELVDGQLRIHVDDDGIGIPEAEREKVFTAFTRLDRSRDRATGGYGLGLAIARLVLELHGGNASAHASPLGGARFTLAWPLQASRRQ
ncbi:MAG: ATP-binding protein [Rhodocyclaceae bacterium]|nr:ATP-binding protein [Rhodocyclaceae bacterium]